MTLTLEPPVIVAARRAARPENQSRPSWIPAEQFFGPISYVTLKITNGCNLKCSYCNVEADLPSTPRMSIETFKRVATLLIENARGTDLGLEFHGGEPLLFPDEWFGEAVGFAQALAKKHGKKVNHPMQTNGTRLTEKRYDYLTSLGINIGVSCDGPPEVNNTFRQAGKQVEQAIRMVLSKKQGFGMVLVLSRANCNRMDEVMRYFYDLGVPGFRLNFLQPQGLGMEHTLLNGEEMFNGVRGIFDHMAETECEVLEDTVKILVTRYAYGRPPKPALSCWELQCQAGRTYCAINLHGDVFSCGTDMSKHRLGHIDDGFDISHTGETLCSLHKKDEWYTRCFDCNAHRICSLSCPTSHYNEPKYRDSECDYIRRFYCYLHENPKKVFKVLTGLTRREPDRFAPPAGN